MSKEELFRKVYINGDEKNLPKEYGYYFIHEFEEKLHRAFYDPNDIDACEYWKFYVDWYLIEQQSGIIAESGRKYRSIPDDMDVETWDAMTVRERLIYKEILKPSEADINTPFFGNSGAVIPDTRKVIEPTKTAEDKQKYVVGFMFDSDRNNVVLIRKQKPAWQKNKLNGVGGKIELGETPLQAMYREYKEEAGIAFTEWDNFLTVEYKTCVVYFFKGFSTACYEHSDTMESERIEKYSLDGLPFSQMIFNLNWIIFMALDPDIQHSEAMEEYRNQAVQLPSEEEINEKYPSEFGDSVIMESGKSYEEVVIANRFRKEGAKWIISKLTP